MATGYTSILKLALPVTGELGGTWGTVVNDNITQMVEQAVAGLATINTWTTNSHTLTVANGTSSESRCAMLVAADGAGLSAAGTIVCPAASKLYILKNGTSYQITLTTASGTGVAVPTGQTAFLFCDGTNVLPCVTNITNAAVSSLKVLGSTSGYVGLQAAATAGSTTYTLPAADGTSGQLLSTNGSGVLSWATGASSGVTSVTGTSPVASSGGATPAISLSANYGDTLNPYASKTANYVLAAPNGSAGAPTFRAIVAADIPTLNQNTTGTASNVTGTVAIANGGTGQTTAANAINALLPSQTSNSGKYLTTNGTVASWATVSGGTPAGANTQIQYNNSGSFGASSNLTWDGAGTLRLSSDGVVVSNRGGNNFAAGQDALGGAFLTSTFNTAVGSSTLAALSSGAANTAVGYTAGNALTTASNSTYVGAYAGTSCETQSNNTAVGYNAFLNGRATSVVAIGARALEGATGPTYATGNSNVAIGARAGLVVQSAANNVLIGYDTGSALTTGNSNTFVGYQTASTFLSGNNNTVIGNSAAPTTTSVSNEITLGNSSIATLRCQVTTITALSDARDKKDVQDIPLGVSFIQRLHPVSFVWNTRDEAKVDVPEFGFIAQELQQAQRDHGVTLPGLVYDINPERLEASPGTLIPVLVKAVQELQAQIDDLKRQLATRG